MVTAGRPGFYVPAYGTTGGLIEKVEVMDGECDVKAKQLQEPRLAMAFRFRCLGMDGSEVQIMSRALMNPDIRSRHVRS
jgi:hypothetical protein